MQPTAAKAATIHATGLGIHVASSGNVYASWKYLIAELSPIGIIQCVHKCPQISKVENYSGLQK
jgi:hypothetical protein